MPLVLMRRLWGKRFGRGLSVGLFLVSLAAVGAAAAQDFVLLGKEGVWIRQGSTVLSGHIGAAQ